MNLKTAGIEKENILSVYSGKNGSCCCGCAGKHYYNSAYQEEAGKSRGYTVTDDEINDKMIKRVITILKKAADDKINSDDSIISTVVGNRLYIAYLKS